MWQQSLLHIFGFKVSPVLLALAVARPSASKRYGMRVWLPHFVYKTFPLFVGTVGLAGCMTGSAASVALGGVLVLYSGGVCYLRKGV
jgi:hypothetical protein